MRFRPGPSAVIAAVCPLDIWLPDATLSQIAAETIPPKQLTLFGEETSSNCAGSRPYDTLRTLVRSNARAFPELTRASSCQTACSPACRAWMDFGTLSRRTGISCATLLRVERCELSLTVGIASTLCSQYGWTLPRLMADAEQRTPSVMGLLLGRLV
jgi:hypothetical protein